jgi:serine/threonine-protein kinase
MPALVTLTVLQGSSTGRQFTFNERTTSLIGKETCCHIRFPKDRDHHTISRHHCLVDINPPDVRIRDLGSRNGTYVNGELIGQRPKDQPREVGAQLHHREVDLKDGDEIQLGGRAAARIRVSVHIPVTCVDCGAEVSTATITPTGPAGGSYRCEACRRGPTAAPRSVSQGQAGPICARCGKDVAREIGWQRHGEFVCAACQADPVHLLNRLLEQSQNGNEALRPLRGYRIVKELGRGGMGAVYLVCHQATGAQLALKVMLPQVAAHPQARDLFLREAANTRALNHPHVVRLHDVGFSQGSFFFTLEYCPGGSVLQLLKERKSPLSIDEAAPLILQVLSGLDYAHQAEIPQVRLADGRVGAGRGLVHRDLKPGNIFLAGPGKDRVAKIGDYGLAKAFVQAGFSGMSATGARAGTPVFMPRQQVIEFKYARPEVDVWAAAATLYHLLTGKYPREFARDADPWQVVLQTKPIPIRRRNAALPKRFAAVIDAALVDDPEIGMKTAAELREALGGVLG